ncbi:MAG: hypothetical protein AB7P12_00245 [Alphaproteobacteria bacterium]
MKTKTRYAVWAVIRLGVFLAFAIYVSLDIVSASSPFIYTQSIGIGLIWIVFAWMALITVREYRSIDDSMSAEQQRVAQISPFVAYTKGTAKHVKTSYAVQGIMALCLLLAIAIGFSLIVVEASQTSIFGRAACIGFFWIVLGYLVYDAVRYFRTKIDDDIRVRDEYLRITEEKERAAKTSPDRSKG